MDLSKLGQHEKLALYSAIVVFLTGLISNWGGLLWLAVLAAIGVVVVVLLPQLSPSTSLPAPVRTIRRRTTRPASRASAGRWATPSGFRSSASTRFNGLDG